MRNLYSFPSSQWELTQPAGSDAEIGQCSGGPEPPSLTHPTSAAVSFSPAVQFEGPCRAWPHPCPSYPQEQSLQLPGQEVRAPAEGMAAVSFKKCIPSSAKPSIFSALRSTLGFGGDAQAVIVNNLGNGVWRLMSAAVPLTDTERTAWLLSAESHSDTQP